MKRVVLAMAALLVVSAGCIGATGQTAQEFEENSELVQDVNTNESSGVAFTLTEDAHYTTESCWFNPATKVTQCTYTDHSTDIESITVEHNGETVRAMDEKTNYEGETIDVRTKGEGQYTVIMHYESGHTDAFGFNQTADGNITSFEGSD